MEKGPEMGMSGACLKSGKASGARAWGEPTMWGPKSWKRSGTLILIPTGSH